MFVVVCRSACGPFREASWACLGSIPGTSRTAAHGRIPRSVSAPSAPAVFWTDCCCQLSAAAPATSLTTTAQGGPKGKPLRGCLHRQNLPNGRSSSQAPRTVLQMQHLWQSMWQDAEVSDGPSASCRLAVGMPGLRAAAAALVCCWQMLHNRGLLGSHDLLASADSLQLLPALPAPGMLRSSCCGPVLFPADPPQYGSCCCSPGRLAGADSLQQWPPALPAPGMLEKCCCSPEVMPEPGPLPAQSGMLCCSHCAVGSCRQPAALAGSGACMRHE